MKTFVAFLSVAVFSATAYPSEPASSPPQSPPPAEVTAVVRRDTLFDVMPTVGTFKARQITKLGSQVAGRVEAVLVDVGDNVKKGQELVRLERNFFEIEMAQRQADLDIAKLAVSDAKRKLERARELWGDGVDPPISQQFLDDAQTGHSMALARLNQAEQAIRFISERLKETVIRAPYDGVIMQRFVHQGEPVQAMFITPLLEIQEVSVLELLFSLPQESLPRVKKGMPVLFRVEGLPGGQGMATLETIFPANDEATRAFRCRVIVQNPNQVLRPSLLAQVGVVKRQLPNVLAVPRSALTETLTGWRATVVADGKREARDVKIGLITFMDSVEILDGLREGEQVVLAHADASQGKESNE